MKIDSGVLLDQLGCLLYALRQLLLGRHVLLTQFAGGGFTATLLPVQQNLGLIGLLALLIPACLSTLLPLALLLHGAFCTLTFQFAVLQLVQGVLLLQGFLFGVVAVITAIATQPQGRQLHNALHRVQQLAVMADDQQAVGPVS